MSFVNKKTKIIATVGPSCNTEEKLLELARCGADVFRLNFSHGSHELHAQVITHIRAINAKYNLSIAMLQDLQGPKIRTGEVENNGVELKEGASLLITTEKLIGNAERIYTSYTAMPRDVKAGDMILIDDGKLELKVISTNGVSEIKTEVVYGGILKSKKGINLPNTAVSEPSLTEKDREDLLFGLQNDVDWIALSFVRTADDIREIKQIIAEHGSTAKVVAKIEKPEALVEIDEIIELSDALMIARGDLGVEIEMEDVPLAQKMMIRKCNAAAKPVIVATQMMESMITSPRPTRAETNDVAQAVMDGADTVMLSAETASGMYPFEAVKAMVKIIQKIEKDFPGVYEKDYQLKAGSATFYNESVIASASHLAKDCNAKAIIGVTQSGFTAFRLASHRPKSQIYIFTDNKKLLNKFSLVWGVKAFYYGDIKTHDTNTAINNINEYLKSAGELKVGDAVVNTTSMPIGLKSHTNIVKLSIVE